MHTTQKMSGPKLYRPATSYVLSNEDAKVSIDGFMPRALECRGQHTRKLVVTKPSLCSARLYRTHMKKVQNRRELYAPAQSCLYAP